MNMLVLYIAITYSKGEALIKIPKYKLPCTKYCFNMFANKSIEFNFIKE